MTFDPYQATFHFDQMSIQERAVIRNKYALFTAFLTSPFIGRIFSRMCFYGDLQQFQTSQNDQKLL